MILETKFKMLKQLWIKREKDGTVFSLTGQTEIRVSGREEIKVS